MTRLAALHLGRNALTGSLPVEWGQLPRALPRLTVLGLQGNRLSGTLPPEWGAGFAVRARCLRAPLRPAAQAHGDGPQPGGRAPGHQGLICMSPCRRACAAGGTWGTMRTMRWQGPGGRAAASAASGRGRRGAAERGGARRRCGRRTWRATR